jgi:hypothetical protein
VSWRFVSVSLLSGGRRVGTKQRQLTRGVSSGAKCKCDVEMKAWESEHAERGEGLVRSMRVGARRGGGVAWRLHPLQDTSWEGPREG